jgi:GrpB-like predicted nucleotidyltransferase (UPF0157 family)
MKPLNKFDKEYFLKYKNTPVKIKPYDPRQTVVARKYVKKIKSILNGIDAEIIIKGSTAFKIAGKGDVEIGVHSNAKFWKVVLEKLEKEFGGPENLESDYARINRKEEGLEVEIIVLRRYESKRDLALTLYLVKHPKLLDKYVKIKKRFSNSKRDYQIEKNRFFAEFIKRIPENYIDKR